MEYEEEDKPVKLPCGHVFGEECVLTWALASTPTRRHNGCPSCHAELLPPSSVVRYWASGLWSLFWSDVKAFFGNLTVALFFGLLVALFSGLLLVLHSACRIPDSQLSINIQSGSIVSLLVLIVLGWRWAMSATAAMLLMSTILWLMGRL